MKNVLYMDADFVATLLVNEEQTGNTISVVIDADETETQEVVATAGETVISFEITPNEENILIIQPALWYYGNTTQLALYKGEVEEGEEPEPAGVLYIKFPEKIDTDASLYKTSDGHYSMQGGQNIQTQIIGLQDEIDNFNSKVIDYILPTTVRQNNISDGGSSDALEFEYYNGTPDEKVSFYSCFQFYIATTADTLNDTYGDATLTVTLIKDGQTVATATHTYGDGNKMLMLNYLLENLSKGNHGFKVRFSMSGGALSQLQFLSAYLLVAATVETGEYDEDYDIDTYDDFADFAEAIGDEIVGEYIDLSTPEDGGAGNFSGLQFCSEWLSAFIRPMEYFALYKEETGYPAPAITQDSPLWATYYYENQLLPAYLDNKVYSNSGKHINFWTATISPPNRFIAQDLVAVKMWGAYVGKNVQWKVASNEPTHGFIAFYYDHTGSDITVCDPTDEYFNGYNSQGWNNNFGSHNSLEPTFILVYNVPVFKQYLSTMNFEDMGGFLANHHFALCECNVSKKKA